MIPAETFKNSTFIQHLNKQKMPTLCILEIEGISFNLIENHYKICSWLRITIKMHNQHHN